ncbi:MAG: 2-oxoacid:acceptor oxidoreductase family protein [Candidatus Parcubacteria bacterium]|nr:2-oxoacid:acceptor oxidoreductase family protein [Candidatus Parcubacteria bacterium]
MITVRVHGRGGQGNVTLAELIAMAAFYDGKQVQAFPSFGVERKGAPVTAFVKIDETFIRERQQVYKPEYIIIQDPSLVSVANVLEGAGKNTVVIINSNKVAAKVCPGYTGKVYCVPVLEIALKEIGRPIINTAMLGAFVKISGMIKLESAKKAISEHLGEKYDQTLIDKNIKALVAAYDYVK